MIQKLMLAITALSLCLGSMIGSHALGQEPLDGPNRIFRDELLDKLVGTGN